MNKYNGLSTLIENYFLGTKLTEDVQEDGEKHYYLEGIYAQAELENKNGRNYPLDILKGAVDQFNEEWISTNRALGELMHPEGLEIDLDRVCMRILDLHQDSTNPANFLGKSRILDGTPKGDLVIGLLKGGTQLGVSTRGAGSVDNAGNVEQLILVTVDAVLNPSAPDAFMTAIKEDIDYTKQYQYSKKTQLLKDYYNLTESALSKVKKYNQNKKVKLIEDFLKDC